MKRLMKFVAAAALVGASLGSVGIAQAQHYGYGMDPTSYEMKPLAYKEIIDKMSPEDRAKLTAMSDKMMQADMDYKVQAARAEAQHEMDMAKMRRDMEFWILTSHFGH